MSLTNLQYLETGAGATLLAVEEAAKVSSLSAKNTPICVQLLELPDNIRGYEDLKVASLQAAKAAAQTLIAKL
ncbi:hypothetical protein GOZ90_25525 [Agrobacterium vitis]|uniref:Uncharacterized protein n=1 Tax=Agrobacterium vitis TaxID=373 RepID=A0A6L6VMU7_AGRVI|nr:hypothetical protein [Agrobacterium vitis]MUZ76015.1 hypothetical protein [Agrobacterium vitis]